MEKRVEFWNIEVLAYLEGDEDLLVTVKGLDRIFHVLKSLVVMSGVLSQVDKVQDRAKSDDGILGDPPNQTPQQNLCHVLPLTS